MLYSEVLQTPVGEMFAVADNDFLLMLDYVEGKYFYRTNNKFFDKNIINQSNKIINLLQNELNLYFNKQLTDFSIPVKFYGTEFQKKVWKSLLQIPYGTTISYRQQSEYLNIPLAVRAVANANSRNKISIIVPCHRVIGTDGKLVGYAGGIERKQYLLNLERITLSESNP